MELFVEATDHDPVVVIGDIAHIEAASDEGPRANPARTDRDRDSYENLILLCKNCHAKFDGQKNAHTVELIQELKRTHEAWVRASLPERGKSKIGWTTVLLRAEHPLDQTTLVTALAPDYVEGSVIEINVSPAVNGWDDAVTLIRRSISGILAATSLEESRFAVFALAPVTACLYLGYCMTNRPRVQLFQYDRDRQTWSWPKESLDREGLSVKTITPHRDATDIAFLFQLSARIDLRFLDGLPAGTEIVSVGIDRPHSGWLGHSGQLRDLGTIARQVFEASMTDFPDAQRWHIFYAGPAPGAVVVGQQLNPTMTPPVQLYEYRHPNHLPSLLIVDQGRAMANCS